jgi:hypothetical protein
MCRYESRLEILEWLRVWVISAAICTGISGLLYVWDGSRQLSAHSAASPKLEANS